MIRSRFLALLIALSIPGIPQKGCPQPSPDELFLFAQTWHQTGVGEEKLDFLPEDLLCLLGGPCPPPDGDTMGLDFGDAPDTYRTTLSAGANGGARHQTGPGGPFLGTVSPDSEAEGLPNPHAEGDDGNRREEVLDRLFGIGGVVAEVFGNSRAAFDVAVQEDGKIVTAGFVQIGSTTPETDMAVVRHHADGTLDMDFGDNGVVLIDFGVDRETASSVAVQGDGKIVIGGKSLDPPNTQELFYVARLDQNGMLDMAFSEDGQTTFAVGDPTAGVNDIAVTLVEGLNKILLVGTSLGESGDTNRFSDVVRLNDDGTPDMEFGVSGRRGSFGTGNKIHVQPEGRLLIAGSDGSKTDEDYRIFQLDEDGDFTSFGDFGTFTIDRGATDEEFVDVLQLLDGTLVGVAGNTEDFVLLGIDLFGDGLDSGFGMEGVATTDFGGVDTARAIVQRTDGRLVAVGGTDSGGQERIALATYLEDGSPDPFFGQDGTATADVPGMKPVAAAIQKESKLVVVGSGEAVPGFFSLAQFGAFEDDEDGVLIAGGAILDRGQAAQAMVTVSGSNGSANLFGWIDFNGNGSFEDPGEQVADGTGPFASLGNGTVLVDFMVPADAAVGTTYARWRVSTSSGLGFDGEAPDGEVEDYRHCLIDTAAGPVSLCQITLVESGMGGSNGISLSADGTRRAFTSSANLTGGNPDGNFEVFLYDTLTGALTQITVTRPTTNSLEAFLSGDGSRVFFFSTGNLTGENFSRLRQLFSFDIATGETTQWTFDDPFFGDPSLFESLTVDHSGTLAAFITNADLTEGNGDGNFELFLLDTQTGNVTQVTDHSSSTLPGEVNDAMISGDGSRIVFDSDVDFVGNNADRSEEIFAFDVDSTLITQITATTESFLRVPKISFDGSRVVFDGVSNLTGTNADLNQEVFLHDSASGMTTQITQTTGNLNVSPWISGDGFRVSFQSNADFAGANADGGHEVFLFDTRNSAYTQITVSSENLPFQFSSLNMDGSRVGLDGRRNLTGENPDGNGEVYVGTVAPLIMK